MSKISNCFQLVELLMSGKKYTIKEISSKLEISPRMVRTYKDDLEKAGIYIESLKGCYGGYFLTEKYSFPVRGITKGDIDILKKIKNLKEDEKKIIEKIHSIYFNNNSFNTKEEEKLYNSICYCIKEKRKMEILYKSTKGSVRNRIIHPYAIYNIMGTWFISSYCEYKEKARRFRLHSIIKYKKCKEKF